MRYLLFLLWPLAILSGKHVGEAIKSHESVAYYRFKAKCLFDGEKFNCEKPALMGEK